jgi:hypothetical protein
MSVTYPVSYPSSCYHPNNIRWRMQIMDLLIRDFLKPPNTFFYTQYLAYSINIRKWNWEYYK